MLRRGSQGPRVRELQRALLLLGHVLPRHGADGKLGTETLAALRVFSTQHGLAEPGDDVDERLVGAIVALGTLRAQAPVSPLRAVEGVDVSGWQLPDALDWRELAQDGVAFAFVKASQGLGSEPARHFARHWGDTREAGLLRGAYHFAELRSPAHRAKPDAQADKLISCVTGAGLGLGELPLVLDLEWQRYKSKAARSADVGRRSSRFPASAVVAWGLRFGERVKTLTGGLPALYVGASFWRYRLGRSTAFADWPLWQPAYTGDGHEQPSVMRAPISLCAAWPDGPAFWQFAGSAGRAQDSDGDGDVGFDRPLDRNLYLGSLEELRGLAT